MPRSPTVYSLPPGTTPQVADTPISSAMFNSAMNDIEQTFNTVQPVAYGGNGVTDNKPLTNSFGLKDATDPTKRVAFDASAISTATTRTFALPNQNGTLDLRTAGKVVNTWRFSQSAYIGTAQVIPGDDTIPQVTEGLNIISQGIVLSKSTNIIRATFSAFSSASAATAVAASIFQVGTANAKGATATSIPAAGSIYAIQFTTEWLPGTLNLQVNVNFGPTTGGGSTFAYINGNSLNRLFGGAGDAVLVLQEIEV